MRVGIFGTDDDPQVEAVRRELHALGAEVVLIHSDALEDEQPISERDGRFTYRGDDLTDLEGFYVRSIPLPFAQAAVRDDAVVLHEDWFIRFMQQRERASFFVAWLLSLQDRGARLINPPHAASVLQYKPFQLHALRKVGARVPKTLITNDPHAVRAFAQELGDVIFKPLMGGAVTRSLADLAAGELDAVSASPVIFQERIPGDDVRVMLVGDEVVSSVIIRTPTPHLDFRDDPVYARGDAHYEDVTVPPEVVAHARTASRACGLVFAGVDLKRTPAGEWVFLELNSSPIYLDVERKRGHPISRAIALRVMGHR